MNAPNPDEQETQDTQDMARLAAGHDTALNDLMTRHADKLFHYLLRSLQNEEDAADLAQETFVKIYQNRARFDARQKFSTWLYAIASNLVRDRFRWRLRHAQVSLDAKDEARGTGLHDKLAEDRPSPVETIQTEERAEAVRRAVAALPEELRLPLILTEYEGRSQAEVGEILGCTTKAVETRLYRARQLLRARLGKILETI